MSTEFKDTEWLIEGLVGRVNRRIRRSRQFQNLDRMGDSKNGSHGWPAFWKVYDHSNQRTRVDEEKRTAIAPKRLKLLQVDPSTPIYLQTLSGFHLSEAGISNVIEFAKEKGARLVILDSLVRLHSAKENDAMEMASVFRLLKEFNREGMTVAFIHHNRKQGMMQSNPSQDMRGSSDILASLDCHLAIERKEGHLIIRQTKLRQGEEMRPFKLNIINDEQELRLEYGGEPDETKTKKMEAEAAVRIILSRQSDGSPLSKQSIFELLKKNGVDIGFSMVKAVLDEMVKKGEVTSAKGEKNKKLYSLSASSGVPIQTDAGTVELVKSLFP